MDWINRLNNIQNKVRFQLHSRKLDDLESVYKLMSEFDKDNSGKLDKYEFQNFLSRIGVFLSSQELRAVYDQYDTNKDEQISYAEFIQLIRTSISEKRLAVVKHAFQFLDRRNNGKLNINELIQLYRAEAHPRVVTRQKSAEQVRDEFINAISKKSLDGQNIIENDFLEYYADVNATLPQEKEEYFVDIVLNTWGITSSIDYVSTERLNDLELILYEKIRQKTSTKNDEGKTLQSAFKYFDLQSRGVIDIHQFKQTLEKFGCVFTDKEIHALFNKYDTTHSGKICYDEFSSIFATLGSQNNANVKPIFDLERQPPTIVLEKIRNEFQKRNLYAFRALGRACTKADNFLNGYLELSEFQWVLKEVEFQLTKTEFNNLFKYFDKNNDGKIYYQNFINLVRGNVSQQVVDSIAQKYSNLQSQGPVSVASIVRNYNSLAVQEIYHTKKCAQELSKEFQDQWQSYVSQPQVSQDQFVDFFVDVFAFSQNEDKFQNYIQKAFP
ncbi:hypothetical protein IMG5_175680 [Ichthyophthirius multifiliis]|uniref:EF-hand domain-containing protein n=1 Tax=Ichthyophthirius multifiliis TaxID=5932 RepID=G0R275_ICHMU|nr:hypothetical protein IMG5_175680 [Ichthyophthirius multifiliis]EGR28430.1 hypothetical protein IMG5_175680 [Ichthyophthirius multifiliis]|eukprot:XP_004029666.1 hypothetical protein IMG5_175680 [Ichthyophthirius multifiliis]